jgi:hypothetical protein
MVSASVLGERVFSEIKRLCCCGLDETTLLGEVIERLRRVVPFDAYCNSRLDPLSGLITRSVYERMGGEKEARFFFEHLYFEDEVSDFNRMVRDRRPIVLLSEATEAGSSALCGIGSLPVRSGWDTSCAASLPWARNSGAVGT